MDKNLKGLYYMLGGCAIALLLTGLLLPLGLNLLSLNVSRKVVYIFQSAFIISGILDIWLIIYAKKKLG